MLLILATHEVSAQVDTSTNAQKMAYLLKNIDKSGLKTGILYDNAIPWTKLQSFGTEKYNTSDFEHWKQAYYELDIASERNIYNVSFS